MEEKNLLEQILAENKKRTTYTKVAAFSMVGILVAVVLVLVMAVPEVFRLMNEVNRLVNSAETLVTTAETSLEEISVMTESLTETSIGLNDFIADNSQTIADAISGIDAIDVETLNEAISDLHDTVSPFANFMNRFK